MINIPSPGALWGSPWHGLIQSGMIGATTQAHPQPASCNSWLIDMGLPALSLTPAQLADAALHGYEWRNYALLPGGHVYGKPIGANTYIFVDTTLKPWLVALSYSFPVSQTLRLSASIKRFGLFGHGEATPIIKTVDVACQQIELVNPVGTYTSRSASLMDVHTNGSKALVGVFLENGVRDLFSCVELFFSGDGGTDGAGLAMSAVEIKGQTSLTHSQSILDDTIDFTITGGWDITFDGELLCPDPPGLATFQQVYDFFDASSTSDPHWIMSFSQIFARYAYYDQAGNAKAIRLKTETRQTTDYALVSDWSMIHYEITCSCNTGCPAHPDNGYARRRYSITTVFSSGWWLMLDDVEVDSIAWERTVQVIKEKYVNFGSPTLEQDISSTNSIVSTGSLSAHIPAVEFSVSNPNNLPGVFRGPNDLEAWGDWSTLMDGATFIADVGIHRMNSNAVAFWLNNGTVNIYGSVHTPKGIVTCPYAPSENNRFAWQRKTNDHDFKQNLLAYV